MNNHRLYQFLFWITVSSCYYPKVSIDKVDTVSYSRKDVSDISFFEKIQIDSSEKKKRLIQLFYDINGKLVLIKLDAKNSIYKLLDSGEPNMIVSQQMGPRYRNVDTIVFSKEKCYHKLVNYTINLRGEWNSWAGNTSFYIYEYKNDVLGISDNTFQINDSTHAFEGIHEFIQRDKEGDNLELSPYRILEKGIEKESSKLSFFRKYFLN